jgi:acetolactate synthase regulatory subunit
MTFVFNPSPLIVLAKAGLLERMLELARNYGFAVKELNELARLVETHRDKLMNAWVKFHG